MLYLHQLDHIIGKDKTIPREAGANLAKLSNWLEMKNDMTRRFSLELDEGSVEKSRAVKKLMRSNVELRDCPASGQSLSNDRLGGLTGDYKNE